MGFAFQKDPSGSHEEEAQWRLQAEVMRLSGKTLVQGRDEEGQGQAVPVVS